MLSPTPNNIQQNQNDIQQNQFELNWIHTDDGWHAEIIWNEEFFVLQVMPISELEPPLSVRWTWRILAVTENEAKVFTSPVQSVRFATALMAKKACESALKKACESALNGCIHPGELLQNTENLPVQACPECGGKLQHLGGENYCCLACEWDNMAVPAVSEKPV